MGVALRSFDFPFPSILSLRIAGIPARGGVSMSISLTTRQVDDVSVVDVAGKITLGEGSSSLRQLLQDLVRAGHKKILLNLQNVRRPARFR